MAAKVGADEVDRNSMAGVVRPTVATGCTADGVRGRTGVMASKWPLRLAKLAPGVEVRADDDTYDELADELLPCTKDGCSSWRSSVPC